MNEGHTIERLKELQALPLERKVGFTAARIIEWYNHFGGKVYVSFSGGKDSTVLLHIARSLFPDMKAMFLDTGLEYPEIREFVRSFDNVDWVRPKMSFKQVIENYGYPVISKEVAEFIREKRDGMPCMVKRWADCERIERGEIPAPFWYTLLKKWKDFENAPFKISEKCCDVMKKAPAEKYQRDTKRKPIIGMMAEESLMRMTAWLKTGCNAFDSKHPKSSPMSFWTGQDVLRYIKLHDLPIAKIYGDIVEMPDGKLYATGAERTGCVFCLFGITGDRKPNRIQRLAVTHPKLWEYCIYKLGLKEVMEYVGEPYMPEVDLFNYQLLGGCNAVR